MRTFRMILLATILALALPLSGPPITAQAADCQFVLGFKTLHDMIPDIVGSCLVDEHHNPTNGDGLQETTAWHGKGGLLVWRKADNWTAFTDGANTWINGPYGLQKRANTECLSWEQDCKPPPARPVGPPVVRCSVPDSAVSNPSTQTEADGTVTWRATVQNTCPSTTTLMIDVRSYRASDGPPSMDARTIIVANISTGASAQISTRIPASASAQRFSWRVAAVDADTRGCLGPGGTRCLTDDPLVASAVWALRGLTDGMSLLQSASDSGIQIARTDLPPNVLGAFSRSRKAIRLDSSLDSSSIWVRGDVLAHELQHASDAAAGNWPTDSASCYAFEGAAFRKQAAIWTAMWQGNLPENVDSMHRQLNSIAVAVFQDPVGFARALVANYRSECEG
jgi:hypothetical protein